MKNPATEVSFRPLTIPASLDDADATDFHSMMAVRNTIYREQSGHDDHTMSARELLPHYAPNQDEKRIMWLIVDEAAGTIGRVGLDLPLEAGSRVGNLSIEILREYWGRGIGAKALALAEARAREYDRDVVQTWSQHSVAQGDHIDAPTGYGRIPLDHTARFLRGHGFGLEQVERNSAFDMRGSFDHVRALLERARTAARGYRIIQWEAPTPPEYVDAYAWMKSRMSTDAPSADTVVDEERWDAERVARNDEKFLAAGRTLLVTAAQHIESGALCAFNELVPSTTIRAVAHQEDTLVLREHRGHRLGLLVKCAGLLTLRERALEVERVITYNAEENRPMLDINEAIGFAPVAYEGVWKKSFAGSLADVPGE